MAALYWKWEKWVPPSICNALLESLKPEDWKESIVGDVRAPIRNVAMRNNYVQFLNYNHWMEGILYNHVRYANKSAEWNYDIDGISPIQVSKYEKDEFYGWHRDCNIVLGGLDHEQRKLSVVLQLNDPSEYTGGGLELEDENDYVLGKNILLNQGDVVVFPSLIKHRAIEVIEGTRYSATGWITGPQFK